MSVIRITKSNIENFTLETYPTRTFISSSDGITGSVALFVRNSKIEKDAVPNEDYGSDVLKVDSIEELRRTVVNDKTRYYSHTTGTVLSFTDHEIVSDLFHTSSGMKVGWSAQHNSNFLVFSGSVSSIFELGSGSRSWELAENEKERYFTTKNTYGGNYQDIFITYRLMPGPSGHSENLTGSHPPSFLTQSRAGKFTGYSTADQRITQSGGISLLQGLPTVSLVLQKSKYGSPGTWIDVKAHNPTYKDFLIGDGVKDGVLVGRPSSTDQAYVLVDETHPDAQFYDTVTETVVNQYGITTTVDKSRYIRVVQKQNLFNSQSYTQGVEKIYTSSIFHNETLADGDNGPWYFRFVQSSSFGMPDPTNENGWAIRDFKIETKLASGSSRDVSGPMGLYLDGVNLAATSSYKSKKLEVTRFEPSMKFTKDTLRKNAIRNVLFPYYRVAYPGLNWAFTNYHTLNFFTASTVPSNTALIYPAGTGSVALEDTFSYSAPSSFTFQFYINPRYTADSPNDGFKAGTILHLSSSYAISLITGSGRDLKNLPDTYKIVLQLSHSADIAPSKIGTSYSGKNIITSAGSSHRPDLIFTSSEIPKNRWTHIGIRWEAPSSAGTTPNSKQHTGSFVINGVNDTEFVIPSGSLMPSAFSNPQGDPDALIVGNFYDGPNRGDDSYTPLLSRFFNANVSYNQGLTSMYPELEADSASQETSHTDIPDSKFNLDHPLNAEVHDIRMYNRYMTLQEILTGSTRGPSEITKDMLMYVPVFFVKETRSRNVLQTPFKAVRTSTDDPFNAALSFGVGGRHINLQNFTREFVKKEYPRLYHLTASELTDTTTAKSANYFLYESGSIIKSNLTILPNDNGKFTPNFDLLVTGGYDHVTTPWPSLSAAPSGSLMDRFTSDTGVFRTDLISLDNMISTASVGLFDYGTFNDLETDTSTIASYLQGSTPEDPGLEEGAVLTILDRTRDPSSNEVSIFDVSNMFYGQSIQPETFTVSDKLISGADGKIILTFKDNGMGGLYRADAQSPHPRWANYGSVIYEEGIAVITDPTAMHFGKDQFEVTLTGKRPVFVKEINIPLGAGSINSSSNPNWIECKPTDYEYENAEKFVYITNVNLHDENFNIIGKATLGQPLVKRDEDKYLIRLKMDY